MQSRSCLFIYLLLFPSHICYEQTAAAGSHLSDTPAAGSSWLGAALRMRGSLRAPLSWRWRAELPGLSRKRAQRSGANADNPTQSEECAGEQPAHLRPPLSSAGAAVGLALLQLVSFGAFVLASALPGCQVWVLSDNSWKLRAERSRERSCSSSTLHLQLSLQLTCSSACYLLLLLSSRPSTPLIHPCAIKLRSRGEEKRREDRTPVTFAASQSVSLRLLDTFRAHSPHTFEWGGKRGLCGSLDCPQVSWRGDKTPSVWGSECVWVPPLEVNRCLTCERHLSCPGPSFLSHGERGASGGWEGRGTGLRGPQPRSAYQRDPHEIRRARRPGGSWRSFQSRHCGDGVQPGKLIMGAQSRPQIAQSCSVGTGKQHLLLCSGVFMVSPSSISEQL